MAQATRRPLTYLVIHCSATPAGRNVTPDDIRLWHRQRGWKTVGYSDFITLDGTTHNLRRYNSDNWVDVNEVTNGAAGINSISRHVCYAGGCDAQMRPADTRTPAQLKSLEAYVKRTIANHPNVLVAGHNQFAAKACPSFDTVAWLRSIGVPDKNIYRK